MERAKTNVAMISPAAVSSQVRGRATTAAFVVGGCLLVALGAQVRVPVPFTEVPMTLQSLAVLLVGFSLRPAAAMAAMVLYVVGGLVGLPFFAAGRMAMFGSTGGYIVGFVVAAGLVSFLSGSRRASVLRLLVAGMAGTAVIFLLGVAWRLVFFSALDLEGVGLLGVVASGVLPFLFPGVLKLLMAVALVVSVRGLRQSRRYG